MDSQERQRIAAEWEVLIGRFSLAMGEVELNVSQMLMLIGRSTRGLLNERLKRLSDNLQDMEPSLVEPCRDCIEEVKRLKKHRNEILHSALSIYVFFDGIPLEATVNAEEIGDKEPLLGSKIISFDERRSEIDPEAMRTFISDVRTLNREMTHLLLRQLEFNPGPTTGPVASEH
ncbi:MULTISPECIES: hypothetical protein [Stenotrophomonas]|uniref:hypothetical protein n=1 Tax=Stenotrophomonas maltophilia TaxID=40324 RepID=UPI00066C29B4|nr:hypothetical protein [Stenotrophomonas maltophilia]MBN5137991.1 hypothetical protein [Stenotrophomonas maltophilia]MDZ5831378.1 hypothetical protein [Stenotrophomonas maltophilia]HEL4163314.1 hypothetical protein [Stenotrophomonas maltophilia]